MPSHRINKNNTNAIYFITITVKNWCYLLDKYNRWDIIANSLKYCMSHNKLKLYGYVFMINHIHLLFYSEDAIGFIRDFKSFTTKKIKQNIEENEPLTLSLFIDKNNDFKIWQPTNMPIFIESEKVYQQKLQYIHYNPVKKGYVEIPENWYWSSANPSNKLKPDPILF